VQADLYVCLRKGECLSGFGGAHFFHAAQHDHGAIRLGEGQDGVLEER
jgi:hypothetical protein